MNFSSKEKYYYDLQNRLKNPGYLDSFLHLFQSTKRKKTIPDMIKKRIGLVDGKKWTYDEIGESIGCLQVHPCSNKKIGEGLSRERVRQCLFKGYQIILKEEKERVCHK